MEDKIKELYELIPEGYFNSEQELRDYITDENKLKEVYEFIPKDYFKDSNEYVSYFGETLKKKVSSQGSSPKEFTLQSYSQETPITEKDWVGDIAVGAISKPEKPNDLKIREQNFTLPLTNQEQILKIEKTPILPVGDIDTSIRKNALEEQNWHAENVRLWLSSKPLKKSQEQWTAEQRQKVREYNGILYDIMQTTQESDVNHYLNVIKSPQMKALTSNTDKMKEEKLSLSLTNKFNRAQQLNKDLQKESIITDDELHPIENDPMKVWDTQDIADWDKKLNISLGRWVNMAIGGSVLGMAAQAQMPDELRNKEIQESLDIQANYAPSKMEELTAVGFGFLLDAPIFNGLGGIFGSLSSSVVSKLTTRSALNMFTGELMAKGLTKRAAQGIALNGFGKALQGGLASGGTLGAYGGISDALSQYKEAHANGEDLDVYDWARTLERIGTDVLMGTTVGVISPIFANTGRKVDMMVDKAIANGIATKADKFIASRINRSLEFATESAVFAAVPAALDGRIPTSQEIMESAAMLAVIKGSNYPVGKIKKIPYELQGRLLVGKTKQKVDFTVRERALLGLDTPELKDKPFSELPDDVIKGWEKDRNIPLLTKYKVMLNGAGIAPVGLVVPDAVRIERETTEGKDRYVVRTYTKTDGEYKYELLSENEFNDKRIAEASASQLLDALWDAKVGEVVSNLDVREKGMLSKKLQELPNNKEVLDAYLLVPELRNSKEKQLAQKVYDAVDEVTGIGRTAYESKLMDDSFGTEKLHEIKAETTEVVSESTQEEKVAETDQNDTKKADIKRRRNEELKESPNTVIKSSIFKSTDLDGNDIFIKVEHRSDGKIQASISEDGKTFLGIDHPKDLIGRITDSEYAKGIFGNDIIEIGDGGASKKADKINAKKAEMPTTEAKKDGIVLQEKQEGVTEEQFKVISEEELDELKKLNTLDNYDIKEVSIPEGIESEVNWQEKLTEKIFEDLGVEYSKTKASTGTVYYTFENKDGGETKLRLGDHRKSNFLGREVDANVVYDETTTAAELIEKISDAIPDMTILRNKKDVFESYKEQKSYKNQTRPELVKAVENLINKKYAVEEGRVQESGVGEYQKVDEGRSATETGRSDSLEQVGQEEIQKEEVNEEKGQREGLQVRTWASEIDDVAEMSIDIESMGRKAAKEKVQEYKAKVDNVRKSIQDIITQNRSTLDKISPEYTKHLLRQVANAKPTNLKNTAQRIERIISNAQTQSNLEKAFKQRKKIKEALRNNPEYASFVRSLNVKAKAKNGGKNLAVEFNKVKVESLPEGLVEDYINVVDNLTSKTPDYGMVENFMKNYSTEIKREAEKASIPNFDPKKTVDTITKKAGDLFSSMLFSEATPEDILSLKRKLSGLLNNVEYIKKQGVFNLTEDDIKQLGVAEDGIKNYIENIIPKLSEEVKGKIEELEREYKKTAIDNITGRIGNVSLLDALDAEKASKVSAILGKLANDDVSLSRLSLNDLEKLSASLDIMEETGVSPVVLNEVYTKARGIDRARKARGSVFEAIKEKIATRDHVKKLFAKGEEYVRRRMAGKPDWAISALFDIGKRVAGMYSNPIYNDITHVGSEAINTSEKFIRAQVAPIYSVFNKNRQDLFERYVYDYGATRKEMKPFDKVGILMAQVRVANLMKNYRGRVVARGGMFYAVDGEGNPYRVDEKIKVFNTAEEALDFVKSQPIDKLSNGRELDFFDIVNYDYKEGERVYSAKRRNAKLSSDPKQNEKEKKFMEEAYDELVGKNGGKLNNIRTEEDAKKLLTPEEVKYWDTIRDVHASTESMAGEVAANEGLVLNREDFYFPMNSKNMSDRAYDQSATLEDIYSQAVQGKSLRVTDNILKKTQRMNYIDFNALRATEKYVRDMSMSYHVLPAMREQVDALNYLVKEYKESDPELVSFAEALRRNIVEGYRIEYTRSSMWGNQKLWIRNSSVDVSKMAKALSNAARNLALNKLERFPLDFFPNSIKMGTAAFKPVDKAAWNQFYQYNPGVAGAKGVAEMQYGRNVIGDYNEIASKGVLQEFSDNRPESGDRVSRQNTWANKFPEVYKKISGKEFDLEKYNSDVDYRNSVNNSEEFEQAKAITDSYIDETLVPTNKYSNRKQMNSLLWTLSSKSRAYNFLNAMSSYTANENAQAFVYFNEAKYNRLGYQGNEKAGKLRNLLGAQGTQNVARMGRLLMSNMAFQVLSQLGYNTSLYLAGLGSDDEKLKEIASEGFRDTFDTTNLYANGFMSILSVMMGGYMNLGRYMMSLMYNGTKSVIAYSGDDKWRNKVQKYTQSIEQSMGASRVIDPNIDVTKDYTKTEALLNIMVPFYGKKGSEIIKSGVEIPKQGYNYFSMKFAEDQWMKDPYESGEMIRALNVTIGSFINPAVSTMDVGIRNAIKEEFVNRVPADLVDEIIYMEDFELTYKDARQRLSDKYDQVYKYLDKKNKVGGFSIDLYGNKIINEYSAIASIKDPETFASEKAGKVFSEYLDKGENRKLYDFYDTNKDQIDELIATTRAIIKDKKMGKEEREAKYDIIRKEVENLKYAYGQFKRGEMKGSVYITGKDLMNMNVNDMLRKIERKALKEFRIDEEKLNSIK